MKEFASLHAINLCDPGHTWPRILRLLHLEPMTTAGGMLPPTNYGILLEPLDEERTYFFGLSLEWCQGAAGHGAVRFNPIDFDWYDQCWQFQRAFPEVAQTEDPEELLRKYHEAMLHKGLPGVLPNITQVIERRSTSALLVRVMLEPDDMWDSRVRFAWTDMHAVAEEHNAAACHRRGSAGQLQLR